MAVICILIRVVRILHGLWAARRQKLAPLERGFFAFFQDFSLFRIQFFQFLILFIIFDLEVILISMFLSARFFSILSLLIILFIGGTL